MSTSDWRLLGITRDARRQGDPAPPVTLMVATPKGQTRKIPLTTRELALLIEHAATMLRVELECPE